MGFTRPLPLVLAAAAWAVAATACPRSPAGPPAGAAARGEVAPERASDPDPSPDTGPSGDAPAPPSGATDEPERTRVERERMVERQLAGRDVRDPEVLRAMRTVPRHLFVPAERRARAYIDSPLPIGEEQTISQPYVVARMTELLELGPGDRVLEVGTGSGYQAAVLAELGVEVWSIEIVPVLAERARAVLAELGYDRLVRVRDGDGYFGWPEEAPFAGIILTAAPPRIPQPLLDQLTPGGRLVAPVGERSQELVVLTKAADGTVTRETIFPVSFVPMTGEALRDEPR